MPAQRVHGGSPAPPGGRPITTAVSLVRRVGRLMVDELVDRLDGAGFPDITASFHPVFENLDSGGTRLTELAARADMTHQAMGDLVCALQARGYLERRPDPTDGRARLVCLTPLGRKLARRALREMQAIEESWQRRFEASGCPDLRAALEAALRSLESEVPASMRDARRPVERRGRTA